MQTDMMTWIKYVDLYVTLVRISRNEWRKTPNTTSFPQDSSSCQEVEREKMSLFLSLGSRIPLLKMNMKFLANMFHKFHIIAAIMVREMLPQKIIHFNHVLYILYLFFLIFFSEPVIPPVVEQHLQMLQNYLDERDEGPPIHEEDVVFPDRGVLGDGNDLDDDDDDEELIIGVNDDEPVISLDDDDPNEPEGPGVRGNHDDPNEPEGAGGGGDHDDPHVLRHDDPDLIGRGDPHVLEIDGGDNDDPHVLRHDDPDLFGGGDPHVLELDGGDNDDPHVLELDGGDPDDPDNVNQGNLMEHYLKK